MNCPNCNQPLSANVRFCGSCGKAVAPAAALQTLEPAMAGAAHAPGVGPGPSASADFSASLLARVKNMVLTPKTEWPVVEREPTSIGQLYIGYVAPLALFAAILAFIHISVIGIQVPFGGGTIRQPFMGGLMAIVMTLVGAFIGLFMVGIIINVLAPTFGGVRDLRQALKTAAYAFTPAWLGAVFALVPFGTLLQLAADCYAIYVLYLGLPVVMHGRQEKAVGYTATVVICSIVLGFVIGAVMAGVGIAGAGAFAHLAPSSETSRAEERDQAANTVGNVIGNMLGTDEKGKQDLGSAMSKLAAAGDHASTQNPPAGSDASNSATSTSSSGQSAAGSASPEDSTEKAFGAAGGLVAALGGALGGSHRVTPVDFQTLKGMLPAALPGMERTNASGEAKQGLGMKSTNATGKYKAADGASVELSISDASAVAGLMEIAESMPQTTNSEGDSGYEKDVVIGGRKVHEKYDAHSHHSELQTLVGKRFEVDLTGEGVDMSKLESALGAVDLGKLESMKDANPQ